MELSKDEESLQSPTDGSLPSSPANGPSPYDCPKLSFPREVIFITLICSAQLLVQAGLGQAIAPLHIIGDSFGATNPGQLSWYAAGYSLTVGTFILVAGRLGDIFGHKILFITGYCWFALWSLIAGFSAFSHNQIFFDICRGLQGIGPAMLLPNALAILGRTYPPGRRKEMMFALFGATAPSGFLVGAIFSSIFAEFVWWPWGYWVMGMVCFACACLASIIVPGNAETVGGVRDSKSFDYLGSFVGIAGLVLFNVAWNQAPTVGWQSAQVIVLVIVGFMFLVSFFFVEKRVRHPLIPLDALNRKVGIILGCIALGWSSFGIWVYYLWQLFEVLRGLSGLHASAQLVATSISGLCASISTGFLLSRMPTPYVMVIAMMAFCVGNVLLATVPVDQVYWAQTFLSAIITPWGMDISFPAATIILSDAVSREHQGIAASLVVTVVNYSISIGLGIAGTVESHVNDGGADVLGGYRGAWYAAIGLSGLGIMLSFYFVVDEWRKQRR
ncbi:hypothetical protein MMC20_001216 [Loxospora ochrophaea]|nr:hypothetical protein [Loxospora ochrophaea]